jgi:uncharacterized C2H2 Zn-finger protein
MAYIRKTRITKEPQRPVGKQFASNLDPNYHYVVCHKDGQNGEEDMAEWMDKGYEPARGDEKISGTPFSTTENHPQGLKVRGNRILMRCPMSEYLARKRDAYLKHEERSGNKKMQREDVKRIVAESGISPELVSTADGLDDEPKGN